MASFFVSRVDTEVDRRLEAIGTPEALALKGKAAVANAQLAYELFLETFTGPRWEALVARGARVQRPLWASTSTKNPALPDTLYVDTLIGPDTVNTMPDATLDAFDDHGTLARTVDADLGRGATPCSTGLAAVGVDLADVTRTLEDEGVASFAKSFDDSARARLSTKAAEPGMNGELVVVDDVARRFAERSIEAFHGRPERRVRHRPVRWRAPPARCYERLAGDAGTQIDWWKVDVYWGDERCVPLDDPDSNYRLAREALLDRVGAANATYPHALRGGRRPLPAAPRRARPVRPRAPRPRPRRPHRLAVPRSPPPSTPIRAGWSS